MKTTITLDPEFIPWEPGAPVVKLRHKRNKMLRAVVGIVVFAVFAGVVAVGYSKQKLSTPAQATPAAEVAVAITTPVPQPTLPLADWGGRPGVVGLLRQNVITFIECDTYRVMLETVVLAEGSTDDGPVVSVEYPVRVECDHEGHSEIFNY